MPRFDFRCSACGHEFEVSRRFGEPTDAADCPLDGATSARVFSTPPMALIPSRTDGQTSAPATKPSGSGHGHGHSHGPGTHTH